MSSIFKINKDKKENNKKIVSIFTFSGEHDYLNDQGFPMLAVDPKQDVFTMPKAYAIKVELGDSVAYYVKRGRYGKLFNPIGLYSEGNVHKQMRHAGKPEWELKKTNEKVFDYYIAFLRTKNIAWLNNAERET